MRAKFIIAIIVLIESVSVYGQNSLDENGLKQGEWIVWPVKMRSNTIPDTVHYKNDTLDGQAVYYHGREKFREVNYQMGVLDGQFLVYDRKGKIRKRFIFNRGMLDGRNNIYNNGKLIMTATIMNGKLEGDYVTYYSNGKLHTETHFKSGCLCGGKLVYDKKGRLKAKLFPYGDRSTFGLEKRYNKKGDLKKSINLEKQLPATYFIFGTEYHSSCSAKCEPIKK